jgi:hypothetical protein
VLNTINGREVTRKHISYTVPTKHHVRPKKPPADFDGAAYLRANPDVAAAKMDPAKHWTRFGYREDRPLR